MDDVIKEGPFPEDDFDVEISAIAPEDESKHAERVQSLPPQGLSRKARIRRLAVGGGALVVALLIIVGSVPALRSQALVLVGAASPTPGINYAPLTPQPQLDTGWRMAGPRYAARIVFAPSAPTTAYTCGVQRLAGEEPVPIVVSVTHDGGKTWQTRGTPASAVTCGLTVNPTNAQDVVLLTTRCPHCAQPQASELYRTFDGGKSWNTLSLPLSGQNPPAALLYTQWMWVGSTLFLSPFLVGDSDYVRLAASVHGQPLIWLTTDALFAGASADASINTLYATSTTLYIEMSSQSCQPACSWFMQSRDQGVSWSPFMPVFQGQPVALLATGADGRTLLGQAVHYDLPYSRTYLRSIDGGATWSALAPKPAELAAEQMYETPDGSVYAAFEQDMADPAFNQTTSALPGIYVLGAAAWAYIVPIPMAGWFMVAWDNAGHPSALWGLLASGTLLLGLERRQL